MPWSLDARTPVALLPDSVALAAALAAGPPAAVLSAGGTPRPAGGVIHAAFDAAAATHPAACACCAGRSPAATALDQLFQARIRNACPWFDRVVALAETPADAEAIRAALAGDALAAARFRLA
jgi:hypothetical protein